MKRLTLMTGLLAVILGAATVLHAKEITVRGKLQKTVEAGGWLIVDGDKKYLIINPKNFEKNSWFKESTSVEAVGETKEVMTTFMEGTPFEAKTITPLREGDAQGVATAGEGRRTTRVLVAGLDRSSTTRYSNPDYRRSNARQARHRCTTGERDEDRCSRPRIESSGRNRR